MSDRSRKLFPNEDKRSHNFANPWINIAVDPEKQTGGDWYSMFLSAALGGKAVHGVNTAPTMEVLGKAPAGISDEMTTGRLIWDPKTFLDNKLGDRVSDQFYLHHNYRGGQTTSGALLAFNSSNWEPSLRARARSTSMLAAGIAAHGCSKQDALTTTSIIASDYVDPEAVEATILPASHLKREMTIVAKPTHRLFSQGTIQQGIIWSDTNLTVRSELRNIAYDWGRITTIARYIAEANVQVCPRFRQEASSAGIAYHIARNAWAAVASEDYHLTPDIFKNVKKIDIEQYNIPSLTGAYVNHEDEIMASLAKFINTESVDPSNDSYRALANAYKASVQKFAKRRKVVAARIEEIEDYELEAEADPYDKVGNFLKHMLTPWQLLMSAVATRRKHDKDFSHKVYQYLKADPTRKDALIDIITRYTFDKSTWLLARGEARRLIGALENDELEHEAMDRMVVELGALKTKLFGIPLHADSAVPFTAEVLDVLRDKTEDAIKESSKASLITNLSQTDLHDHTTDYVSQRMINIGNEGKAILGDLQTQVAKEFKEAYAQLIGKPEQKMQQQAINYYMAYKCLKLLSLRAIASKASGFIDGSNPKDTFVFKGVKKLGQKLGFEKPVLTFRNYTDAKGIARDLQNKQALPYDICEAVNYALQVCSEAVGDLLYGVPYMPPDDLVPVEEYTDSDKEDGCYAELEKHNQMMRLEAMAAAMAEDELPAENPYQVLLNTYESHSQAEEYARLNGYPDFKAAYQALGDKIANFEDNAFTLFAKKKIDERNTPPEIPGKDLGYKPML